MAPLLPHNQHFLDEERQKEQWRALEKILTDLRAATDSYTPSNVTPDTSYDADATTTAELADVLGTLIADLKSKGIIS